MLVEKTLFVMRKDLGQFLIDENNINEDYS
jgi:hypothetical protein